eukprot:2399239-Amphidinium_carterae.1
MTGMYEVLHDGSSNRQLLVEFQTGQRVVLDACGTWTLHQDDDNEPFLHCPGQDAVYCCDAISDVPFQHPDIEDETHVLVGGTTSISLWEYHRRHTPVSVHLQIAGASTVSSVTAFQLHQPVGGTYLLWSVSDVFKIGHLKQGLTCSQWCQSWWKWWEKALEALGVDAQLHLRRSMPVAGQNQWSQQSDERGPRFLHDAWRKLA